MTGLLEVAARALGGFDGVSVDALRRVAAELDARECRLHMELPIEAAILKEARAVEREYATTAAEVDAVALVRDRIAGRPV